MRAPQHHRRRRSFGGGRRWRRRRRHLRHDSSSNRGCRLSVWRGSYRARGRRRSLCDCRVRLHREPWRCRRRQRRHLAQRLRFRGDEQCGAEFFSALIAIGGCFRERALDDGDAPLRQVGPKAGDRRRRLGDLHLHHRDRGVRIERQATGQQTIEHDAHRVEIRAAVDLAAEHLLRRHVGGRAHHVAAVREVLAAENARDAEVHHLDRAALGNHHVGGLEVAMHDAGAMRVSERVEHLHTEMCGLRRGQRAEPIRQIVKRLAAHELHDHQEIVAVLMQLVDRRDARVVQPRERHRFRAKAFQNGVVCQVGIEHLDRNVTIERLIHRLVDSAHAAASELLDDAVFADRSADHC